jgi:hypothetical protein
MGYLPVWLHHKRPHLLLCMFQWISATFDFITKSPEKKLWWPLNNTFCKEIFLFILLLFFFFGHFLESFACLLACCNQTTNFVQKFLFFSFLLKNLLALPEASSHSLGSHHVLAPFLFLNALN